MSYPIEPPTFTYTTADGEQATAQGWSIQDPRGIASVDSARINVIDTSVPAGYRRAGPLDVPMVCEDCGAVISEERRLRHDYWHSTLVTDERRA